MVVQKIDREAPVRVPGKLLSTSAHAYRFMPLAKVRYVWLPKSLCTWDDKNSVMYIPQWMAIDKGLAKD